MHKRINNTLAPLDSTLSRLSTHRFTEGQKY